MNREANASIRRVTLVVLLCWFSMIGFDFFLHGGLLTMFYTEPSPFLLPLEKAFRLIPLGYLSLLLLAVLLVWLRLRLDVRRWRDGFVFGIKLGALVWGAMVLGLMSISTASPALRVGWFFGQTIELGIAGMFAGSGPSGARLTRLLMMVIALIFLSILMTVVLQSIGIVPTVRI
jgi:hypothetical protein